jgi:hypothetical protein
MRLLNINLPKNKHIFLLCLLVLIGGLSSTHAEKTSGFCAFQEEERGPQVLYLQPGVSLLVAPNPGLRLHVWIDAWVKTSDLYDGIRLQEKTKLFGSDRKLLGKVSRSFNPMKILEEADSVTHLVLAGFIEKACVDSKTIPEEVLSNLLDKAENNEKLPYFEAFLNQFHCIQIEESNEYTSYLIQQPEFTRQLLEPRILMVFYKKELIAIFHTRAIRVTKYDSIEMGSQYKMVYNSKFSEHTKKEMVEIYKRKLAY